MDPRALGAEGVQTANNEPRDARTQHRDGNIEVSADNKGRDNTPHAKRTKSKVWSGTISPRIRTSARLKDREHGEQGVRRQVGEANGKAEAKALERKERKRGHEAEAGRSPGRTRGKARARVADKGNRQKRSHEPSIGGSPGRERGKAKARATAAGQQSPQSGVFPRLQGRYIRYKMAGAKAGGASGEVWRRGHVLSRTRGRKDWFNVMLEPTEPGKEGWRCSMQFHHANEHLVWAARSGCTSKSGTE